jgi:hypothetical protein
MMIGAGCLETESSEQGVIEISHLQPGNLGGDAGKFLNQGKRATDKNSGKNPRSDGQSTLDTKTPPVREG